MAIFSELKIADFLGLCVASLTISATAPQSLCDSTIKALVHDIIEETFGHLIQKYCVATPYTIQLWFKKQGKLCF